jgi:hypothetical protein
VGVSQLHFIIISSYVIYHHCLCEGGKCVSNIHEFFNIFD